MDVDVDEAKRTGVPGGGIVLAAEDSVDEDPGRISDAVAVAGASPTITRAVIGRGDEG